MLSKTTIPNATDKLEEIEVEGTEVYCLRVPRGYDINSLKVIFRYFYMELLFSSGNNDLQDRGLCTVPD